MEWRSMDVGHMRSIDLRDCVLWTSKEVRDMCEVRVCGGT